MLEVAFRNPWLLVFLLLSPAAIALTEYAAARRKEAIVLFLGEKKRQPRPRLESLARSRKIRAGLMAVALALFVVAFAGPRAGQALQETRTTDLDLIVALDVSESMLAEDIAPNRLERAKLELRRLAEERRGDRIGLVIFAGDAFIQSPLTTDHSAFILFLDAARPDLVGTPGTDFSRMLDVARAAFDEVQERTRVLLVISDGENHEPGIQEAVDKLRADGIETMAVGIGSEEGAPIPLSTSGQREFKRDTHSNQVVTRYNGRVLAELAGTGNVYRLESGSTVPTVIQEIERLEHTETTTEHVPAEAELFQWPLAVALLLLFFERLIAIYKPDLSSSPKHR